MISPPSIAAALLFSKGTPMHLVEVKLSPDSAATLRHLQHLTRERGTPRPVPPEEAAREQLVAELASGINRLGDAVRLAWHVLTPAQRAEIRDELLHLAHHPIVARKDL
jgi:hypothetical protein